MPRPNWRRQTIPAVAKRLGVGVAPLRGACAKGEVETKTFNGTKMIPVSEERRLAGILGPLLGFTDSPPA